MATVQPMNRDKLIWKWAMEKWTCPDRYRYQLFLAEAFECALDEGNKRIVRLTRDNRVEVMDCCMYIPMNYNDEDVTYITFEDRKGGHVSRRLPHTSYADRIIVIDDFVTKMLNGKF